MLIKYLACVTNINLKLKVRWYKKEWKALKNHQQTIIGHTTKKQQIAIYPCTGKQTTQIDT